MNNNTYHVIRKIHLYASLSIVTLLLMYVISSYLMIHFNFFGTYDLEDSELQITVEPMEVSNENWSRFLKNNGVSGKLTKESTSALGDLTREYSRAGTHFKVTLLKDRNQVDIAVKKGNLSNKIVGFHRIRGYEGPLQYIIYAFLLDLVGVSLILFAITGIVLWLKLLKNNGIAWAVFLLGLVYVTSIVIYLMSY